MLYIHFEKFHFLIDDFGEMVRYGLKGNSSISKVTKQFIHRMHHHNEDHVRKCLFISIGHNFQMMTFLTNHFSIKFHNHSKGTKAAENFIDTRRRRILP